MKERARETRVRLLLIDPMVLFRASLGWILSNEPGFEIAAECSTPAEALQLLTGSAEPPIDLVLLDLQLGREHADSFIAAARQAGYKGRFLIVAGDPDARNSALALRLGASGIFLKSDQPQRLVQTIKAVMNGDVWVDRTIIQSLVNQLIDRWPDFETARPAGYHLSQKERQVLLGVVQGHSNRKIGLILGLSESAVKNTLQHLFAATGVRTRSQLVRMALEGLLGDVSAVTAPSLVASVDPPAQ